MLCVHFLTPPSPPFKQQISAKAPRRRPFLGQLQLSGLRDRFWSRFAPVPAAAPVI